MTSKNWNVGWKKKCGIVKMEVQKYNVNNYFLKKLKYYKKK